MAERDRDSIYREFDQAVNMTPGQLKKWLAGAESRRVGWKGQDGRAEESVGHASGQKILSILGTAKSALDDEDYRHMRKVVGYVRRHLAKARQCRDLALALFADELRS